jgi:hypothetical protein
MPFGITSNKYHKLEQSRISVIKKTITNIQIKVNMFEALNGLKINTNIEELRSIVDLKRIVIYLY